MNREHHTLTLWIVAIGLLLASVLTGSAAASPVDHERTTLGAVFDPALSLVGEFAPGSVGVPGDRIHLALARHGEACEFASMTSRTEPVNTVAPPTVITIMGSPAVSGTVTSIGAPPVAVPVHE